MSEDGDKSIEPADDEAFIIIDDEPLADADSDNETIADDDELNGFRIRQMVHLRRSNIRSQTYVIVLMLTLTVASANLAMLAYHSIREQMWLFASAYGTAMLACCAGALFSAASADRLRSELNPKPQLPTHEPEFDLLSDGSHHVRNLHDMHDEDQIN